MYDQMTSGGGRNRLLDLRSDTVTRPGEGMRRAMAEAEVGDDVYGEDPTVIALQEEVADLLGKEAALFVASGTQSNLIALLSHCGRGDEYIGGVGYHISKYEAGGAAVLGGISPRHLPVDQGGGLDPQEVKAFIQPDDPHFAVSRLVCTENTFNGKVQDQAQLEKVADVAHEAGLATHLDGARLMNAVIASDRKAGDLVAKMDTVSLCLSKGLGAPVGSVLAGPKEFIAKALRNRKLVGGGMRQSGVLAACGLYALHHNVERLSQDHDHAARLARRLAEIDGVAIDLDGVHTNMIWMTFERRGAGRLSDHMRERGIVVAEPAPEMRIVCHLDYDGSAEDDVVDGIAGWLKAA